MGKILGLDLGTRTIGVSISDSMEMIASAVETFRFKENDFESALKRVKEIVEERKVYMIVLGYPKHMNGDAGIRAHISEEFKAKVEELSDIKVVLQDERLTTVIVDRAMISGNVKRKDRKQKKDEMAAVVILQNYLDRKAF